MDLIKAIDETCVPQEGNSEEFYKGYHTAIIDVFRVLRKAQKVISPTPQEQCDLCRGAKVILHVYEEGHSRYRPCSKCQPQEQGRLQGEVCDCLACEKSATRRLDNVKYCEACYGWASFLQDNGTGREELG